MSATAKKIHSVEEAVALVGELKSRGRGIVFTNGCFDLLHPGHTRYLAGAKKLGDVLVVAVNSDRSVGELKGPGRPIQSERERAEILAALADVDIVTIFDDATPRGLIARLLPQVLVKGGDWAPGEIVGREEVEAAGGRVVAIPVSPGFSSSRLIETVLERFESS
jgi:D-glycero-beta-D-manno-heptose 1-phosphate adenylyltransferase